MNRETVVSSNVESIGYDPETATLEVEFKNGSTYRYLGVPEQEFNALRTAESVGKYLHYSIKPQYPVQRV